jgi:hypothetical protein
MLGPRLVSNTYDPVWDKHHISPFLIWDEIPSAPAANVIAALNPMASKLRELRLQKWLVDEELVHAMVVAGPNLELLKVRCWRLGRLGRLGRWLGRLKWRLVGWFGLEKLLTDGC